MTEKKIIAIYRHIDQIADGGQDRGEAAISLCRVAIFALSAAARMPLYSIFSPTVFDSLERAHCAAIDLQNAVLDSIMEGEDV